MNNNILKFIELCNWDNVSYLVFSDNVFGVLIYYSHFLSSLLALLVGIFVLSRGYKVRINQVLASIMIIFAVWVFCDLILWATNNPSYSMFFGQ